jgi:hypothetical protein
MEIETGTNDYAYNVLRNYYLMHSREFHYFPNDAEAKNNLKVIQGDDASNRKIDLRKLRVDVVRQRIDEIFKGEGDATQEKIDRLLGIGIWKYIKDLGYNSFSDLRYDHMDENKRKRFKSKKDAKNALRACRKFATRENALKAFKSEVKESILTGSYESKDHVQNKVGASIQNYSIKWKKDVLYPVYNELIIEEFENNPKTGDVRIKQRYSFAQSFIKNQGGLVLFKLKNNIPINKREENMLLRRLKDYKNINEVKESILLRRLILQAVKPKPRSATTEEYIWDFVKKKTGKSYDTFRIPQEINYLKCAKKIEGGRLNGGYWRLEKDL